jgi:hypothetical protein
MSKLVRQIGYPPAWYLPQYGNNENSPSSWFFSSSKMHTRLFFVTSKSWRDRTWPPPSGSLPRPKMVRSCSKRQKLLAHSRVRFRNGSI